MGMAMRRTWVPQTPTTTAAGTISKNQREIRSLRTFFNPVQVQTVPPNIATASFGSDVSTSDSDDRDANALLFLSMALTSNLGEPKTYEEAMAGPEQDLWVKAMKQEIENFLRRNAWELTPQSKIPRNQKPVTVK